MSTKHYIIEAKGKETIQDNKITIEGFTYLEKNHRVLDSNGQYKKIKKENISISDWISIGLTGIASVCILVMIFCIAIMRDFAMTNNTHIDNVIAGIGLIFAIISMEPVRKFLNRHIIAPRILKKCMLCILIMLAPFYLAAGCSWLGISPTICNCISVVAIIISVYTF